MGKTSDVRIGILVVVHTAYKCQCTAQLKSQFWHLLFMVCDFVVNMCKLCFYINNCCFSIILAVSIQRHTCIAFVWRVLFLESSIHEQHLPLI